MGVNKKKITHQRAKCIGCGSCALYDNNRWSMDSEDGKANLKDAMQKGEYFVAEVDEHEVGQNKKAADACPMNIIKLDDEKK
jgi:ferredoxin